MKLVLDCYRGTGIQGFLCRQESSFLVNSSQLLPACRQAGRDGVWIPRIKYGAGSAGVYPCGQE
ncbi:MAG: hypothetical protein A2042_07540 [Candidatus Schekmanbacteria bacterium GWA2_38_11]|uniref:Uncharacterized protein n=1 Tax=Candidatus Schekmanbacteria bacterium GWA2_38_11 TaxID=1817876 RepID=A0A1F7RH26_9BACT|nr:MAG: hypothetical protein A2042_07540 [Candidatus Schekmanbacteria bacterium GWA2_38_11]